MLEGRKTRVPEMLHAMRSKISRLDIRLPVAIVAEAEAEAGAGSATRTGRGRVAASSN